MFGLRILATAGLALVSSGCAGESHTLRTIDIDRLELVRQVFPASWQTIEFPRQSVTGRYVKGDVLAGARFNPEYCARDSSESTDDAGYDLTAVMGVSSSQLFFVAGREDHGGHALDEIDERGACSTISFEVPGVSKGVIASAEPPVLDGVTVQATQIRTTEDGVSARSLVQYMYSAWVDGRHQITLMAQPRLGDHVDVAFAKIVFTKAVAAVTNA